MDAGFIVAKRNTFKSIFGDMAVIFVVATTTNKLEDRTYIFKHVMLN